MTLAKAWTRTTWSGVEHTNHEATTPLYLTIELHYFEWIDENILECLSIDGKIMYNLNMRVFIRNDCYCFIRTLTSANQQYSCHVASLDTKFLNTKIKRNIHQTVQSWFLDLGGEGSWGHFAFYLKIQPPGPSENTPIDCSTLDKTILYSLGTLKLFFPSLFVLSWPSLLELSSLFANASDRLNATWNMQPN